MSESTLSKAEPFSINKLQKKIKFYVEKGIKRNKTGEELHQWATAKVNDWIDIFYPEQGHMKS